MANYICDLCSKQVPDSTISVRSAATMQRAIRLGFKPFKTPGIDMSANIAHGVMFGLGVDAMAADWQQRALADQTNWGLCPECARAFDRAADPFAAPPRTPPASVAPAAAPRPSTDYGEALIAALKATHPNATAGVARFEAALAAEPDSADKRYWLGAAYLVAESDSAGGAFLDRAIRSFEAALELDPAHKNASAKLLGAYLSKGDDDGARRTAMRWAKWDNDLPPTARQWLREQEAPSAYSRPAPTVVTPAPFTPVTPVTATPSWPSPPSKRRSGAPLWVLAIVGLVVVVAGGAIWAFTTRSVPLTPVAMIEAGENHTCAMTTTGTVKCWGSNGSGQLGDGTTTDRRAPVEVTGLTGVVAIAAGDQHTCALTSGGAVKCWGDNAGGQLGDGTTTARQTPVEVTGLTEVTALSVGGEHTCALTRIGDVKCWGDNVNGQLGDGTRIDKPTPVAVAGLGRNVTSLAAGWGRTCALSTTGTVQCWGGGTGDGTDYARLKPVYVVTLSSGIVAITAGKDHTCALTRGGELTCWGPNSYGQLGDGTSQTRLTPVKVAGLNSEVKTVVAGGNHTCALVGAGSLKCWGNNGYGALGDGTITQRLVPVDGLGQTAGVAAVAVGSSHICVVPSSGAVRCSGLNNHGQLGNDSTDNNNKTPVAVVGLGKN